MEIDIIKEFSDILDGMKEKYPKTYKRMLKDDVYMCGSFIFYLLKTYDTSFDRGKLLMILEHLEKRREYENNKK